MSEWPPENYSDALQLAVNYAVAASESDKAIRHLAMDSNRWPEAKAARDRFPREIALATVWAHIAEAMK